MKRISGLLFALIGLALGWLLLAPVPVEPLAWQAPLNPGYTGAYAVNDKLAAIEAINIGEYSGPEDIVLDSEGRIYVSVHEGRILRLQADGSNPQVFAETGGRPLGMAFNQNGELLVTDAYLGLLSINTQGEISVLADQVNGTPIRYANNLDVDEDGRVYFSDASTKFGAREWGGSYPASLLDLMEHGGHGRLLKYDPLTQQTSILATGLNFANGVALTHDEQAVLINETGNYRVLRFGLAGGKRGELETLVSELPAFPDNLTRGRDGRYWVGLVSPRNPLLDSMSDKPFLRKMVQRLPAVLRPKATYYSHVIAINDQGQVVENLQDPAGSYPTNTSVFETENYLYIGSLTADVLGRLKQ